MLEAGVANFGTLQSIKVIWLKVTRIDWYHMYVQIFRESTSNMKGIAVNGGMTKKFWNF